MATSLLSALHLGRNRRCAPIGALAVGLTTALAVAACAGAEREGGAGPTAAGANGGGRAGATSPTEPETTWGSAGTRQGPGAGAGGRADAAERGGAPSDQAGGSGPGLGSAGAADDSSACPSDLVGFATVEGGTLGGADAAPTVVRTQAELRTCATDTAPRVCRVEGTLQFSPFEEIAVASQKTIIGGGRDAEIVMGGFVLNGVHDVIIRNLTIRDSYVDGQYDEGGDRDGVQLDGADHVWIDHCRFNHLGDGQIDSRKNTTFETVSWNILENHNKAFGIGWTDDVVAQITIHHNWLRNTVQRNPSTDNVLRAHLFNNLLEDVSSYGNYARGATNMVIQNSVFVNVKDPHYADRGTLVASGNVYRGTSGRAESTGSAFSFFDPGSFYDYRLDDAAEVEALLARCAGPRAEL